MQSSFWERRDHRDQALQSPDAGPSHHLPNSNKSRSLSRLPPRANEILNGFIDNVDRPTKQQRLECLERIRAIPGAEWYTDTNIYSRIVARRQKRVKVDISQLLYPSLQPENEKKLRILLKNDPNPTPRILEIWAAKLMVDVKDVKTWVELAQERRKQQLTSPREEVPPRPHLPTPEHTASPEPSQRVDPQHVRHMLATSVNTAVAASHLPQPPESIPTTLTEFNKSFEYFEYNMNSFMQKVRNGEYESLGLTASDIPPL